MSSDEGWEEVYNDDLSIKLDTKEKQKRLHIKYDIFISLVNIFKEFLQDISIPQISEYLDFNIINKMYYLLKSENQLESTQFYFSDYVKNIKYFKFLKEHNISSRIFFIINKNIESFLEISVNKGIIKNKNKYKGCVFYIDINNTIEDYSWYFSTNMKNHSMFLEVLKHFKNLFSKPNIQNEFTELDERRRKEIPTSIIKFKKHPLYCLESLLKINQVLIDKKLIQGYFRGEPVFLKKYIVDLKSDKYFYKHGKIPKKIDGKDVSPSKIYKDLKFYSEDQVEDILLEDMSLSLVQDYLHPNHIPLNCVYIQNEHDEIICKKLKVDYRRCFVGFNKQNPIYKGVFIYKKDLFIVSNFIFEYFDFVKKLEIKERIEQIVKNWEKLTKLCKRYKKLRTRLG